MRRKKAFIRLTVLLILCVTCFIAVYVLHRDRNAVYLQTGTEPDVNPAMIRKHTDRLQKEKLEEVMRPDAAYLKLTKSLRDNAPEIRSPAGFVYRLDTDEIIFQKSSGPVKTASLAKLFSIAYSLHELSWNTVCDVGKEETEVPQVAAVAGLKPGQKIRLSDLVALQMLESACDATRVMARAVVAAQQNRPSIGYSEAEPVFVREMRSWLKQLNINGDGLHQIDGLDLETVCRMEDIIRICVYLADEEPDVAELAGTFEKTVRPLQGPVFRLKNTNRQLDPESVYFDPHVRGVKTGTLKKYFNLVTAVEGEERFLIGVFGSEDDDQRYQDTVTLKRFFTDGGTL